MTKGTVAIIGGSLGGLFAAPLAIVLVYSLLTRGAYGGLEPPWTGENFARLADPLYIAIFLRSFGMAAAATARRSSIDWVTREGCMRWIVIRRLAPTPSGASAVTGVFASTAAISARSRTGRRRRICAVASTGCCWIWGFPARSSTRPRAVFRSPPPLAAERSPKRSRRSDE